MFWHRRVRPSSNSKTVVRLRVPWVRIPPPPPPISHCCRRIFHVTGCIRACPVTSGAYAGCAQPLPSAETGQVRPTGSSYRKSLLRRFWWYGLNTRWRDTVSETSRISWPSAASRCRTRPCVVGFSSLDTAMPGGSDTSDQDLMIVGTWTRCL